MNVEKISTEKGNDLLVCKIELTHRETEALLHCLVRTSAKGAQLTISMELEKKIQPILIQQ